MKDTTKRLSKSIKKDIEDSLGPLQQIEKLLRIRKIFVISLKRELRQNYVAIVKCIVIEVGRENFSKAFCVLLLNSV